ncbi:MAG TPA: hypothetical protein VD764_09235 [Nocardioides sp.]|nr:hypothetical protein [Nocardioides sp.]
MSELRVPPTTLSSIRGFLDTAASGLEATAGSAPHGLDGGDMTPVLTAMLSKLVDNAATLSEGLTVVSAQVTDAEADFWTSDAAVSDSFAGGVRGD